MHMFAELGSYAVLHIPIMDNTVRRRNKQSQDQEIFNMKKIQEISVTYSMKAISQLKKKPK